MRMRLSWSSSPSLPVYKTQETQKLSRDMQKWAGVYLFALKNTENLQNFSRSQWVNPQTPGHTTGSFGMLTQILGSELVFTY